MYTAYLENNSNASDIGIAKYKIDGSFSSFKFFFFFPFFSLVPHSLFLIVIYSIFQISFALGAFLKSFLETQSLYLLGCLTFLVFEFVSYSLCGLKRKKELYILTEGPRAQEILWTDRRMSAGYSIHDFLLIVSY